MKELSDRNRQLTEMLDLAGSGIEYGPLHRRILEKTDYDVRYADYADRDHLVAEYRKQPHIDVDRIPEVDIVTGRRPITELVPASSVDFIIASHVLEHVPDLLGWIEINLTVLKMGGRIAVAYPDRRYCFDLRKPPSTVPELLAAYFERRSRPSLRQIANQYWNVVRADPVSCWNGTISKEQAEYIHRREAAVDLIRRKAVSDEYTDVHCWAFADQELVATLEELRSLLDLRFDIVAFTPTARNRAEFHLTIEKVGDMARGC